MAVGAAAHLAVDDPVPSPVQRRPAVAVGRTEDAEASRCAGGGKLRRAAIVPDEEVRQPEQGGKAAEGKPPDQIQPGARPGCAPPPSPAAAPPRRPPGRRQRSTAG